MVRCALLALFVASATPAHADGGVRAAVRFGVLPLDLDASADTPFFGDDLSRAVTAYNMAAAAYDREHGTSTARATTDDVAVHDTLLLISPGLELGSGPLFFRAEVPLGFGSELRSVGVGLYPLNLQAHVTRKAALYASLGGQASKLDRSDMADDSGALVAARAAAGIRFSHALVEVGYNAFALGGSIDSTQLDAMTVNRNAPPPRPETAISAGEAAGIVDVSVGVSF
jgi:hypothetical protein